MEEDKSRLHLFPIQSLNNLQTLAIVFQCDLLNRLYHIGVLCFFFNKNTTAYETFMFKHIY